MFNNQCSIFKVKNEGMIGRQISLKDSYLIIEIYSQP